MNEAKLLKTNTVLVGVYSGSIVGVLMGIFFGISTTPFSVGFSSGIGFGLLFGIAFAVFSIFANRKYSSIPLEISKGGVVVHGPASRFKGGAPQGGWLYLTQEKLIFKTHNMNFHKDEFEISLKDIRKFGEHKILSIFTNGIFVELPSGRREKFVVAQPDEWIEVLAGRAIAVASGIE